MTAGEGTLVRAGSRGACGPDAPAVASRTDGEEIEMEELTASANPPKTDAEYEAELEAMLAEMQRMDENSAARGRRSSPVDEFITSTPPPKTAAEYRAAIEALLAAMSRMNEQSEQTWAEIDALKAETKLIKERTDVLKADTQARLRELVARFG